MSGVPSPIERTIANQEIAVARPSVPRRDEITIGFAHEQYRLAEVFARRLTGMRHFQAWSVDELETTIPQAHVVAVSALWRHHLLERAQNLQYLQALSVGLDNFDVDALRSRGVRIANAAGITTNSVAEHALALMLSLSRRLHLARDEQRARTWRGRIADPAGREDTLGGKTILIVGLGAIGSRLAQLAKALEMRVLAVRATPSKGGGAADSTHAPSELLDLLPRADVVALTCPLTRETERLVGDEAFAAMRPTALLVNVARGQVVDEGALIAAMTAGTIAGAALDCFEEEPLPTDSPLWVMPGVIVTSHVGAENRRYEERLVDLVLENVEALLARGEQRLRNERPTSS